MALPGDSRAAPAMGLSLLSDVPCSPKQGTLLFQELT